jgi:hypothetical protein
MAKIWRPSWSRQYVLGVGAALDSMAPAQGFLPDQTPPGGVAAMPCVCRDIADPIGDLPALRLNDGRFPLFWLPFPDPVAAT